jgi:hypothetical protein
MTLSAKEASSEGEQELYSMDELMILAKMETCMNGKPFHYLNIDTTILPDDKLRRKEIISELTTLFINIRLKKKEESAFFDYQNLHFDAPDYAWLQQQHPGVNVNGWRVVMALMDPLKYGQKIDHPIQQVRATISQRSAKT